MQMTHKLVFLQLQSFNERDGSRSITRRASRLNDGCRLEDEHDHSDCGYGDTKWGIRNDFTSHFAPFHHEFGPTDHIGKDMTSIQYVSLLVLIPQKTPY